MRPEGIPDGIAGPRLVRSEAVLVTGPWLAGVSALVGALRKRCPGRVFTEALHPGEAPSAVIFVVSAVAPMVESDADLLDAAATHTDLVIGAVTKVDVHVDWREVLAGNRDMVATRNARYRSMPWIGVAAAPQQGEPDLDELVQVLSDRLADDTLANRNLLRSWETHLSRLIRCGERPDDRMTALRAERDELQRAARLSRSERTIALRSQVQQARVQLGYFARSRCASVRTELSEDIADWNGRRADAVVLDARQRYAAVVAEVDDGITDHLADMADQLGLPAPDVPLPAAVPAFGQPGLASRRVETRLMTLLGVGFGLGAALAVSRVFAGLAPGLAAAGVVAGAVAGLLLAMWVVGLRAVLRDRALLDRWVTEATARLRESVEQLVANRVLLGEMHFTGAALARQERDATTLAGRIDSIDAELRQHGTAAVQVSDGRALELPRVRAALAVVFAELESG